CITTTVTYMDGILSGTSTKSQTRTFTATDSCGNQATTTRTVTWTEDNTLPVITATGTTLALGCNPTAAQIDAALGSATATDNCSTPTVTSLDGVVSGTCAKSQTRTFTATDSCGNQATTTRTVSWTEDTTVPVITATGTTLALGCNPTAAQIDAALGSATATDNCGTPTVTSLDGVVSGTCAKSQTRTFIATDGCGNQATTTRTVTWTEDTTVPVITATGTTLALGCNPTAAQIDAALGSATATDNCSTPTVTSLDGAVSGTCAKSQTRTFTATDSCGNQATTTTR